MICISGFSLQHRQRGIQGETEKGIGGGGGLLPSSLVTCPLEHGTMQYSSRAREPAMQSNRQDSPQRCSSFFPSQSAPHQRSLVSALADRSVSVKLCSDYQNLIWAGLLANPPTHSKSKCAIKNAHLSSSSRLPNAYASYLRDRVKWYCKRYGISFIRYTIQISSGGGCWGFFSPPSVQACRLNLGRVRNRYSTCWKTPIWMPVRQPSTYSDWLSFSISH